MEAIISKKCDGFNKDVLCFLTKALQVKRLLDNSSDLPHIQLRKSIWCDFLNCNIDAVYVGTDNIVRILSSSSNGADLYQYLPTQIPRETILEVISQINKMLNDKRNSRRN